MLKSCRQCGQSKLVRLCGLETQSRLCGLLKVQVQLILLEK
jgi:hypothetical protein